MIVGVCLKPAFHSTTVFLFSYEPASSQTQLIVLTCFGFESSWNDCFFSDFDSFGSHTDDLAIMCTGTYSYPGVCVCVVCIGDSLHVQFFSSGLVNRCYIVCVFVLGAFVCAFSRQCEFLGAFDIPSVSASAVCVWCGTHVLQVFWPHSLNKGTSG